MSVPLKARPPTFTLSGVMSTVIVVDFWRLGSCPTMLKPKVVPSSGLDAVAKKCVSVLVDGCGLAAPTDHETLAGSVDSPTNSVHGKGRGLVHKRLFLPPRQQ